MAVEHLHLARRDLPLELADLKFTQKNESDPLEFEGYASVWGRVDSYGDTVLKGAFAESLKERRPMMLFGHANGMLKGNLHIKTAADTPMANVFLTLAHGLGMEDLKSFGDSTAEQSVTQAAPATVA